MYLLVLILMNNYTIKYERKSEGQFKSYFSDFLIMLKPPLRFIKLCKSKRSKGTGIFCVNVHKDPMSSLPN